jgi:hypothetical protein
MGLAGYPLNGGLMQGNVAVPPPARYTEYEKQLTVSHFPKPQQHSFGAVSTRIKEVLTEDRVSA